MCTGHQVIQREDNVPGVKKSEEGRAICKHLRGINPRGAMLCPRYSVPGARPLPAAPDSMSG